MPFTGPIEDRLAIRDLYDAYADASIRGDREDWLACWSDDAHWWTHYFEQRGKDALGTQYDQLMAAVKQTIFTGQVCSIEVTGDSARCRALCSERLLMGDIGQHLLTGFYHDELVREQGRWLFSSRVYKVLTEELAPPIAPLPAPAGD